jgi:hypothetical protein
VIRRFCKGANVALVDGPRVRALADEIIVGDLPDFERLDHGFYAKTIDADIAHVLKVRAWKGAQYSLAAEPSAEVHHDPPPQLVRVLTMPRLGDSAGLEDDLDVLGGQLEPGEIQAILVAADRAAPGS